MCYNLSGMRQWPAVDQRGWCQHMLVPRAVDTAASSNYAPEMVLNLYDSAQDLHSMQVWVEALLSHSCWTWAPFNQQIVTHH